VPAGKTETVSVLQERTLSETYSLMSTDAGQLLYLSKRSPDKETAEKLRELSELQNEIAQIERQLQRLRLEKDEETRDQERHRANLAALEPGADLYKRATRKLEESETRIEAVDTQIADLSVRREEIRETLGDAIRTF
jgi:flagellar biosynthesis chaperone FliJ